MTNVVDILVHRLINSARLEDKEFYKSVEPAMLYVFRPVPSGIAGTWCNIRFSFTVCQQRMSQHWQLILLDDASEATSRVKMKLQSPVDAALN